VFLGTLTLMPGIESKINYINYTCGKSTWSEIQTLIEALKKVSITHPATKNLSIYTDCQTIVDLLGSRRIKLQKNNFLNAKGVLLANASLYRELYNLTDKFQLTVTKIKGHAPASQQISIFHNIFSCIDKFARRRLRALA
jgi:hypothetical protein